MGVQGSRTSSEGAGRRANPRDGRGAPFTAASGPWAARAADADVVHPADTFSRATDERAWSTARYSASPGDPHTAHRCPIVIPLADNDGPTTAPDTRTDIRRFNHSRHIPRPVAHTHANVVRPRAALGGAALAAAGARAVLRPLPPRRDLPPALNNHSSHHHVAARAHTQVRRGGHA